LSDDKITHIKVVHSWIYGVRGAKEETKNPQNGEIRMPTITITGERYEATEDRKFITCTLSLSNGLKIKKSFPIPQEEDGTCDIHFAIAESRKLAEKKFKGVK